MAQYHIIKQQTADIIFSEREKAPDVFTDVSRLFNNRIKDITETIFNEHVAEDVLIRIDTLEVDLGTLPYPFPEEQMASKYREALEAALLLKLKEIKNNEGLQTGNAETEISVSVKAFLEHYLLTGTLPWWGSEQDMHDPEKIFARLLQEEQAALKALIYKVAQQAYVIKRLVFGFTEKVVQDVIYLIEPGQAAFILEYHKDISSIQKKEQLVKAEATEFEKEVWVFILDYLLDDKGSYFNRKTFVRSTLTAMAARFNLSFARLLFLFNEAVKTSNDLVKYADALPSIIKELSKEMSYGGSPVPGAYEVGEEPSLSGTTANESYKIISLYLLTGSFTPGTILIERDYLVAAFLELLRTEPQLMKELLVKLGDKENVKKRIAYEFNDHVVKEVIKLIEPAGAEFIINYSEVTLKIQQDKNIVKAEGSVFKQVLWEFILTFLFSERGSVFNKRMFLESNIRQLAKHYNVEFNTLLSFLTQGITEELSIISDNSSLFYMLIDILKETAHAYPQNGIEELIQTREATIDINENGAKETHNRTHEPIDQLNVASQDIFIKNLLLFWMEHGYLPWWAVNKITKNPGELLDEMIAHSPDEAVLLFQQVMVNRSISYAFFKTHPGSVFKIAGHMADGKQVLSYIQLFKQLQAGLKNEYRHLDLPAFLAIAVMETYKENRFSSFDLRFFLSFYINALARETGLALKETKDLILALFHTANTTQQSVTVIKLIKSVDFLPNSGPVLYAGVSGFPQEEVLRLIAPYPLHTINGVINVEDSAASILQYVLLYNKLPDELKGISTAQADELIFSLLVLLHKINPAAVLQLLAKDHLSSSAKMRMHDIFFSKAIPGTNSVKAMLATYFERDLLHFISEKGISTIGSEFSLKEIITRVMATTDSTQRKNSIINLLGSASLVQYISTNYKGDEYFDTLRIIASEKAIALIKKLQYVFNFIAVDSFERENLNALLREFGFLWFAESGNTNFSESDFTHAFLKFLSQKKNRNMLKLSEQFTNAQKKSGVFVPADLVSFMADVYKEVMYFAEDKRYREFLQERYLTPSHELMEKNLPGAMKKNENTITNDHLTSPAGEEEIKNMAKELLMNEQIYIQNAGLILLHPFLSTFFSRTHLMQEGKFIDAGKQLRAPYLLQYAVTGNEDTTEHQLVLNKILSGIRIEEALPKIAALTEQEKQVSEELLQAVIQQWDKVKNTSIEGFRVSFLQRNGALTLTPEAWVLKIEQRGYDILLQTLPWGMGMIKLSWMDKPLIVEWI